MANGKLLQFPVRNPDLFSREINYQVLSRRHSRQITRVCSPRVTHHVLQTQEANAGFPWVPVGG
jgi:hypothetical protein